MDPAKAKAWQRFHDQVLSRTDWPRGLWFAAVEDALRAALGAESRVLADYRADVAELLRLEQAATGSYHDEKRIEQLEAQVKRLIELADETVRPADGPGEGAAEALAAAARRPRGRARFGPGLALSLVVASLLLIAGVAGAAAYLDARIAAQADRQMAQMTRLLDAQVADLRADLDQRLVLANRLNERASLLHAELSAEIDQFSAAMTESVRSMTALSENVFDELEHRLAEEGGEARQTIDELQAQADGLARGLDQVSLELSSLESRLPQLHEQALRLATGMQRMTSDFEQAALKIDALEAETPDPGAWLASQKDAVEQALQSRRGALRAIDAGVEDLESEVEQSRTLLQGFSRSLDESLRQAKRDGEALNQAVQDMRGTEQQVAELMAAVEANAQHAQAAMQEKFEQVLSKVAEQADLAVLRGQDVIRRVQNELDKRVEAESQKTLEALAEAREAQLTELAQRIAATQLELEQTRAGLMSSWQRMDQAMAERQNRALDELDGHARTIEARVEEFLNALDVMVARTPG